MICSITQYNSPKALTAKRGLRNQQAKPAFLKTVWHYSPHFIELKTRNISDLLKVPWLVCRRKNPYKPCNHTNLTELLWEQKEILRLHWKKHFLHWKKIICRGKHKLICRQKEKTKPCKSMFSMYNKMSLSLSYKYVLCSYL